MGLTVLSLCDGIAGARVALDRCGIQVDRYYASEIKEPAIRCATENYPGIIEIGDVKKISYEDGFLKTEKGHYRVEHFDLVCFGFPCQSLSRLMNAKGRIGLEDENKSGLFYECYRILLEVNPTYFFIENVATMKDVDKQTLTDILGVEPIRIESGLIAPALRKRLYWTNIPYTPVKKKNIKLQDILENGYTPREKARAITASSGGRVMTNTARRFRRVYDKGFENLVYESEDNFLNCVKLYEPYMGMSADEFTKTGAVDSLLLEETNKTRLLSQRELEACQTMPAGYTSMLDYEEAANVLGDGWTIDVICHFFENLT